jgi:hypothetical protein
MTEVRSEKMKLLQTKILAADHYHAALVENSEECTQDLIGLRLA